MMSSVVHRLYHAEGADLQVSVVHANVPSHQLEFYNMRCQDGRSTSCVIHSINAQLGAFV